MSSMDEFYAVIENYNGETVGLFGTLSSAKVGIKDCALDYGSVGGDVACLEFKIYKINVSKDTPYKELMAEFSGINLIEKPEDK